MSKKKWGLLLLAALLLFGYVKLFYKTYSHKAVPLSADYVVAADVKRITNSLIWNYITTPALWKDFSLSSKKTKEISWDDMVKLPDYILAFHVHNQPASIWYALFDIKDKTDFEKGMRQFQFEKLNSHEYVNKTNSIYIFVQDEKLLVATASAERKNEVLATANELFAKKAYMPEANLKKAIHAKSHLAAYLRPGGVLQKETVVTANFNKDKIEINGNFEPGAQYDFADYNFKYASGSLCATAFTQPPVKFWNLVDSASKEKISTALNFNIDSLMQQGNNRYSININEIKTRVDSAVTYTYDDEFNKVEKTTVNYIQEPSFDFIITGNRAQAFDAYLLHAGKLETTSAGKLFLPMPFVKAYCINSNHRLNITSANYSEMATDKTTKAIFFLNMVISKIPQNLLNYLPEQLKKFIITLDTMNISFTKKEKLVLLNIVVQKRKNELPLFMYL